MFARIQYTLCLIRGDVKQNNAAKNESTKLAGSQHILNPKFLKPVHQGHKESRAGENLSRATRFFLTPGLGTTTHCSESNLPQAHKSPRNCITPETISKHT